MATSLYNQIYFLCQSFIYAISFNYHVKVIRSRLYMFFIYRLRKWEFNLPEASFSVNQKSRLQPRSVGFKKVVLYLTCTLESHGDGMEDSLPGRA